MKKIIIKIIGLVAILVLSGCGATGKYTVPVSQTNELVKPNKAAIVFFRASQYGGAITSPLVKVNKNGDSSLVGILGPKEKMVEYFEPGEHTFMVIGESADFMKANLEAGKVYYSIIRPRLGFWKARFSLTPFKQEPEGMDYHVNGKSLPVWLNECAYTQPNEKAYEWHKTKSLELITLYNEYMPTWQSKAVEKQKAATLDKNDGLTKAIF